MTRDDAEKAVRERWERMGLEPQKCPIMFGRDVDNMLEDSSSICPSCGYKKDSIGCQRWCGKEAHKDAETQDAYRKQTGETGRSVPQFSDPAGE